MSSVADVVVIGGGISGTATAYELAKAGVPVTLVEQGELASMASGWTLAGVRQSGRHPAELPLAQAAVRRWERLAEELDADVEYRQDGNLRLARTPDEVKILAEIVEQQRTAGLDLELLADNTAVREVAPALAETIVAASYCPTDGHANPIATVRAFAGAAERNGAKIRTGTMVTGIDVHGGRMAGVQTSAGTIAADAVVVAAGVYTDRLCESLGIDLPLSVGHVPVVQTAPLPPLLRQVLGMASAGFAGRQEVGGRMRMSGGIRPWSGEGHDDDTVQPTAEAVLATLSLGIEIVPALAEARVSRVWGGLIDKAPDAIPVIERTPEIEGLVVATGFSGHGFCLGPITGQILCELVTTGASTFPIEPFRRGRFAGLVEQEVVALHG